MFIYVCQEQKEDMLVPFDVNRARVLERVKDAHSMSRRSCVVFERGIMACPMPSARASSESAPALIPLVGDARERELQITIAT